jgi:hypothetical protein
VSGPLVAGIVYSLRARRPLMAAVYAVGLLEFLVLLPWIAARLGAQVL